MHKKYRLHARIVTPPVTPLIGGEDTGVRVIRLLGRRARGWHRGGVTIQGVTSDDTGMQPVAAGPPYGIIANGTCQDLWGTDVTCITTGQGNNITSFYGSSCASLQGRVYIWRGSQKQEDPGIQSHYRAGYIPGGGTNHTTGQGIYLARFTGSVLLFRPAPCGAGTLKWHSSSHWPSAEVASSRWLSAEVASPHWPSAEVASPHGQLLREVEDLVARVNRQAFELEVAPTRDPRGH
eukprot:1195882-Prorocentrum_minimum.AAC.4